MPFSSSLKSRSSSYRLGAPQALNWVEKDAVTSVKDQGFCGCCWAFAAIAYAESKLIIQGKYTKDNINLSEQYLLECTPQGSCDGGYLQDAFQVVKKVPVEQKYPYQPFLNYRGICKIAQEEKINTGTPGFIGYNLTDSQLIQLLQAGPVAISISSADWIFYKSGVFSCRSRSNLDHAVLLVGYTPSYWIVKNQWGERWGNKGYIWITRTKIYNCGIGFSAFTLSTEKKQFSLFTNNETSLILIVGIFLIAIVNY